MKAAFATMDCTFRRTSSAWFHRRCQERCLTRGTLRVSNFKSDFTNWPSPVSETVALTVTANMLATYKETHSI